ncbi:hypothetical protein [Streptomyces sp. NBC_01006]|uniref:hypothetical protein n=1 Tax=Streptomyces sp. NBC_01006 TaxID=2903716 RepID=UPI00386B9AEA|nr:hypothetical protein OG509_00660 [Streptomyces sp. NBC_01006]
MASVGVAGYLVKRITNARLLAEVRSLGAEALAAMPFAADEVATGRSPRGEHL